MTSTSPPPASSVAAAVEGQPSAPLQVPKDTTPTWELEMLVSGAVIFGLFQLPPLLNHGFEVLPPRFAGGAQQLVVLGLTLADAAVLALITAFVLHLVSRTYWVALVGLDSVYPGGVRWDRLRRGPIATEILRARMRPLRDRISAVDNFCSVIFAIAFMAAAMVVFGSVLLAAATLVAMAVSRIFFGGRRLTELPLILVMLFAITLTALYRLDRRFGARLPRNGWRARALRAALTFVHGVGQAFYGPILNTLMSNVRRRVIVPGLVGLLVLSMGAVALQRAIARGEDTSAGYSYVPGDAGELMVDSRSYADQRTGVATLAAVPFIQSDMIRDPYVRLFIPYIPDRDDPALGACRAAPTPKDATPPAAGAGAAATLGCLAALHAVEVDGRPLSAPDFRFYRDPVSGLVGLVTYISVAGLPRGRNVLTLLPSPPPPGEAGAMAGQARRTTIPFWL